MSIPSFHLYWRRMLRWGRPRWRAWHAVLSVAWGTPLAGYLALGGLGVIFDVLWSYPGSSSTRYLAILLATYTLLWPTVHTFLAQVTSLTSPSSPWLEQVQSMMRSPGMARWSQRIMILSAVLLACLLAPLLWQRAWVLVFCAILPWHWGQVLGYCTARLLQPIVMKEVSA